MAHEITQWLLKWSAGDEAALNELLPLVHHELRQLARSFMRRQSSQHTLQPTALVNEAYLRIAGQQQLSVQNRVQFYGLMATVMRSVLVDHVRARQADKRGGGEYHLSLTHAEAVAQPPEVDVLALDEALQRLAALNPQHCRVVELRFFGGLTIAETAQALGVSHATVERDWSAARAWLYLELSK